MKIDSKRKKYGFISSTLFLSHIQPKGMYIYINSMKKVVKSRLNDCASTVRN